MRAAGRSYRQSSLIPESVMSDPWSTDPLRRLNRRAPAVGVNAAESIWTAVWTWFATVAAAAVILSLVFGYSRSDLVLRHQVNEPAATGSALSASGLGDAQNRASK
jgi:hypothetical protein